MVSKRWDLNLAPLLSTFKCLSALFFRARDQYVSPFFTPFDRPILKNYWGGGGGFPGGGGGGMEPDEEGCDGESYPRVAPLSMIWPETGTR